MSALFEPATVRQLNAKFRETSAALAKACEHVGRSMRGSFLSLQAAVHAGDSFRIVQIMDDIRESELVTSLSAKFHDLRDDAKQLVRDLAPIVQTVLGLSMLVAGAFLFSEAALLALLLMIGGLFVALAGIPEQAISRTLR